MSKKDIKPAENNAIMDYSGYEESGFENQTKDDIAIPFIAVLQALSPQVEENEAAKPGMLFNTVTEELMESVEFVPVVTVHQFVEWIQRDAGGGFVGIHELNSQVVADAKAAAEEFGKYVVGENQLVETFYVYAMLIENDEPKGMAVLGFNSTKIKVYKNWNTKLSMFTVMCKDGIKARAPLFAHKCKLTTVKQKNNHGTFYNFVISPLKGNLIDSLIPGDSPLLQAAMECRKMIAEGKAKADYDSQNSAASADEGGDAKIPF
jgi:hypothetical protein